MTVQFLDYPLQDRFISHWLVAGPLVRPVDINGAVVTNGSSKLNDRKAQVLHEVADPTPGYTGSPVDQGSFTSAGETLAWHYLHCADDHFVDVSAVYPLWQHTCTWAYARLVTPSEGAYSLELTVGGLADVWLNGERIYKVDHFSNALATYSFMAQFTAENELLVRFEQVGAGPCLNQMALRIARMPESVKVEDVKIQIPTMAKYPRRHQQFERMFDQAYLQELTSHQGIEINLRFAEGTQEEMRYWYSLQDKEERIYVEGTWDPDTENFFNIGHPQRVFERDMFAVLRAPGKEYFEQGLRYERRLPITILDNEFSEQPYGDPASRREEALEDAAQRDGSLFAEIAKMALLKWARLDTEVIRQSMARASRCELGSSEEMLGLLLILARFVDQPSFPQALKDPLETCLCEYAYASMSPTTESEAILQYTSQVLAGQMLPERVFLSGSVKGSDLCQKGEALALDWVRQRSRAGFAEWNSNSAFEADIAALALLSTLAENETLADLSGVLLDKMLFLIAVNTYKGVFGTTHGAAGAKMIRSAKLEATSGITRLLWGQGIFTRHMLGTVCLACSDYEYPSFFADIAANPPEALLSKEHQATGGVEVNTVTYKTPDYLLSSAQDYRPGQPGRQEHIWQATLGPDALVFSNHPASFGDDEAHTPGFWLGNAVLPRVAQWNDVLLSVYKLPPSDWLGFTHAHFPVYAFDEWEINSGWAFARKGDGYLAITAKQGLELVKRAPDGYRELRSYGADNVWICQMGRAAQDGDFSAFKQGVLKLKFEWSDGAVRFTGLRGETLAFGWEGDFQVNGQAQRLSGFKHIDNPYCAVDLPAESIEIQYDDLLLRLNFE